MGFTHMVFFDYLSTILSSQRIEITTELGTEIMLIITKRIREIKEGIFKSG